MVAVIDQYEPVLQDIQYNQIISDTKNLLDGLLLHMSPNVSTQIFVQVHCSRILQSTQNQPNCKKGTAYTKKDSMRKVVKSNGPEVAVMVGYWQNF